MNPYVILTDSCADLPKEIIEQYQLTITPLTVIGEGETFPDAHENLEDFYRQLRAKKKFSTSAVNPIDFEKAWEPHLAEGKDVLHIAFSSGLSRTYESALVAQKTVSEKYPERTVCVVDSLCACMGLGLLVVLAARKKEAGASLSEVAAFVEETKPKLCHWFTVNDLFFLHRGGRVSMMTAVAGSMLGIKPVMHMDDDGKLANVEKARGRTAAIDALVRRAEQTGIDLSEQTVMIAHADCPKDAEILKEKLEKTLKPKEIVIGSLGAVIGAHAGPDTLALFFVGTQR